MSQQRGKPKATVTPFFPSRGEMAQMKRAALVREAGRVFRRIGFHQTSLDDVARILNVTKAALYGYVDSKQEILFECHKAALDLGDEALAASVAEAAHGRAKLVGFIKRYIAMLTSDEGNWAVLSDIDALLPEQRAQIAARRDAFDHRLRSIVLKGMADGSIRAVDPKLCVFGFMGMINWLPRWYSPEGESEGDFIAQELSSYFERGMAPEAAGGARPRAAAAKARPRAK
jgi:TetR/AcrR family transcriptional regulator